MNNYFRFRVSAVFLALLVYLGAFFAPQRAAGADLNCTKTTDQAKLLVCVDQYLSALHQKLKELLIEEMKTAFESERMDIESQQKEWIKKLNDCWKYPQPWNCISDAYKLRIAFLQVQGNKVSFTGPIQYLCNNRLLDTISATFYRTDPPAVLLEITDRKITAFLKPSGSGAKYETGESSEEYILF